MSLLVALLLAACEGQVTGFAMPDLDPPELPPDLSAREQEDVLYQIAWRKADILWVVDNSGSMFDEQQRLIQAFPTFMNYFLGSLLDWHVGVVSTDTEDELTRGRLRDAGAYRWLDPLSPNPIAGFSAMAEVGVRGASMERGRRAAWMALTEPLLSGYNAGFYRPDASLHVVVISDEDDSSFDEPSVDEFVAFLQGLKADPTTVTFSAIVGPPGGCGGNADPGDGYLAVVDAVGGLASPICADDYQPILDALGQRAAGLLDELFLTDLPAEDTLSLWVIEGRERVRGVLVASDDPDPDAACGDDVCVPWYWDAGRNSVRFHGRLPASGSAVHVRYVLADAVQ